MANKNLNTMFAAMLEGYSTDHIRSTISFAEANPGSDYADILEDLRKELKKREKRGV